MNTRLLGITLLFPAAALAQVVDNPWSLAPALPTACYESQDQVAETVAASLATLEDAITEQEANNDQVGGQVSDMAEADPFAMAARMQEYAMSNPEKMMEMMQSLQSTGQTIGEDMGESTAREQELVTEIDELMARYKEDFARMRKPFEAAVAALPTRPSEAGDVYTQEAIAQLPAINKRGSDDYDAFCKGWWTPGGQFAAKLDEFRTYLTDERIPFEDNVFEQGQNQWMIQGLDVSNTHSTASMDAVRDYLRQMQRIYALRVDEPTQLHVKPW